MKSKHVTSDDNEESKEAWQNSEGDRLKDFGVDEEADFYDEEDLPRTDVLRRRKPRTIYPLTTAAQ